MRDTPTYSLDDLLTLMSRLRDPSDGCPWDLKQDWHALVPMTIEELYEVVDAIDHQDWPHVAEELGDLLFHIVFYSQLAAESQYFDFGQVVQGVVEKLLRRHPHVFPDGTLDSRASGQSLDESEIRAAWERIKQQEKQLKGVSASAPSLLDDIPQALPALKRAVKLQKKAAKVGYDWPAAQDVFAIIRGELDELEHAHTANDDQAIAEELGDVLFSVANLARKLDLDAERQTALANQKFTDRFQWIEQQVQRENLTWASLSTEALDNLWQRAKQEKIIRGNEPQSGDT